MRFQFWKQKPPEESGPPDVPVSSRFNVPARTDVGTVGLPDDPEIAAQVVRLRRQRELLLAEHGAAAAATAPDNRWLAEIRLIDLATNEIERDLMTEQERREPIGLGLPATPIEQVSVVLDPVPTVRFQIGSEAFVYQEDLDWAERGYQLARSDVHLVTGEPAALVPTSLSDEDRARLLAHLEQSLFVFATDLRDRAIAGQSLPDARLADMAIPDTTDGGWLDWLGASPVVQRRMAAVAKLQAELDRLATERGQLLTEQGKASEQLPFIARRLREVEARIASLTGAGESGTA